MINKQIRRIVNLDGSRMEVEPIDVDHDGDISNVAQVSMRHESGVTNVTQATELGEVIREINKDELEEATGMSGIDMKSRLHHIEVSSILAMDALVALRVLPSRCLAFTRQKKRLSVSLDGKGRQEIVDVVGRKQETDKGKQGQSMMQGVRNFAGL